jgi:energy-coupling factor transport system substrate-specific component
MSETTAKPARRNPYTSRFLLTSAAIGAAGGLLIVGLNWMSIGTGAFALFLYGSTIGIWVLPQLVGQALLRVPGTALLISLIMALINAPLTPYGFAQIPSALMFGLLLEIPFAIFLYRSWSDRHFWIAHPIALVVASSTYFFAIDLSALAPWLVVGMWVLAALSGVAFTALSLFIARRLRAAGVAKPRRVQA